MKRRNFFKALAKAAAVISLAPQIAFRPKPLLFVPEKWQYVAVTTPASTTSFWYQTTRYSRCLDAEYVKALYEAGPEKFHLEQELI